MSRRVAAVAFLLALSSALAEDKRDLKAEEALRKQTLKVESRHSKDLEPIVRWAVTKGLKTQAASLVETIGRITPDWKTLGELKKTVDDCKEAGAPADVKDFDRKLKYAQDSYANDLMKLAKDCAKRQLYTRSYDLIGSVLDANPDHAEARKIRGFVKAEGKWVTLYEADQLKSKVLYKDKKGVVQGWVPKKDVARWDKGDRPFAGDWLPEEDEIKKCQTNEYRAWVVESEHFEVRTNVSRAAAYEFGQFLEEYHRYFFREFISFFDLQDGLNLLFNPKQPQKKKHVVLYYPSRDAYLNHVKAEHGNEQLLKDSAGFYTQGGEKCTHTSHFYKSEKEAEAALEKSEDLQTTLHEVTHQLFAETKEESSGSSGNNWVVEGIASYIETWMKDERGRYVPGANKKHPRLLEAKAFLASHPDWKLSDFLAIGHDEFHKKDRGLHYAMVAAMSHFLMHYDDERYKEDFVRFIAVYYSGKAKDNGLYAALPMEGTADGKKAEVLEKQFRDYMEKLGSE